MKKTDLSKQLLCTMVGLPGAGKTFFARQFANEYGFAHVGYDEIKHTVFGDLEIDTHDNQKVLALMDMFTQSYLEMGMSVIYDAPLNKRSQRKKLRESTKRKDLANLLIWVQTDLDTAYDRATDRDRRKADDRYATVHSDESFDRSVAELKKPLHEDYVVISGKHVYRNQSRAVFKKLQEMGLAPASTQTPETKQSATPQIKRNTRVRLGGRVDTARRNLRRRI